MRFKRKDTLCWECERAAGKDKKCPWATKFEPVPGWNATPTKIKADKLSVHQTLDSFIVHECPMFQLMDFIKKRNDENVDLKAKFEQEQKEDKQAIIELKKQGKTVEEIAFITGFKQRTIYNIIENTKYNSKINAIFRAKYNEKEKKDEKN